MAATAPTTYPLPRSAGRKHQQQLMKLLRQPDCVRSDGRGPYQCRPAYLRPGVTSAASGSAYAEFGTTKVIVSVFGPRESKKAMMYSDIGRLNCYVGLRGQELEHKEYSSMLHKALEGAIILESFPKTTVDVFVFVLESGGSDLPVIISCASFALADAGIMMYDLVASVSVSCFKRKKNGDPSVQDEVLAVIDPTAEEEACEDGSFMISLMPSRNEVTQLTTTGEWSVAKLDEMMELCHDACLKLADVMRSFLKDAVLPHQADAELSSMAQALAVPRVPVSLLDATGATKSVRAAALPRLGNSSKISGLTSSFKCGSPLLSVVKSRKSKLACQAYSLSIKCEQSTKESSGLDLWLGRFAMVGFASAITVEIATGKGLLENFGLVTPIPTLALAVTALVGVLTAFFIFQSASQD